MRSPATVLGSTVSSFLVLLSASCTEPTPTSCWSGQPCSAPVASISVTPEAASFAVGARITVQATPLDAIGTPLSGRDITWSSSNPATAAVSRTSGKTGEVLGVSTGTAWIRATSENKSSSVAVVVMQQPGGIVPVDAVTIAPASASVDVGRTVQLTAEAKDASGEVLTGRPITWSGSNPSIASVSTTGLVTAVSPGIAGITATSEGKQAIATVTATLPPVATIDITPATAGVVVGQTVQLTATPKDASGTPLTGRVATWASSNTAIATVSSSGLVSGVSPGPVTITATSEGKSGAASVTATPPPATPVATVDIAPATVGVVAGQTVQLTAVPKDANGVPLTGRTVTWASSNTAVATVAWPGLVTGASSGTATITATSEGKSGTASVTVTLPPVATVDMTPATAGVVVGQTVQLTATPKDASGTPLGGRIVTWTSSNTAIAAVSSSGLVSGVSAGTVTITATSEGKSGTASVTATPPAPPSVATVDVMPSTATVVAGQTVQLTATPRDANGAPLTGRTVTWASSNTAIATVYSAGLVTGVSAGTVTITATSDGKSGAASVTVTPAPPPPVATVSATPSTATVFVGQTVQLTATPKDASGTPLSGRVVTWASSNAAVATVSAAGLVFGVSSGQVTITATSEGATGTAAISVAVPSAGECSAPQPSWIWCDDFEQDRLTRYFEYDNAGGNFVRTTGVGFNGSSGMRARWATAGQVGAGALHLAFGKTPQSYFRPVDAGTANYRELYWRMYVKNQPGWNGGGADKLSRATIFASSSSWAQAMIAHVWSGVTPNENYLYIDPASGTDAAGNLMTTTYNDFPNLRWLGAARSATPTFDAGHLGQWHCVEARARLNDAGQSNGEFQLWLNGTLEAQRTGLNWVGSFSAYGINAVFFENYWNAGTPQAQERYFDNIVVSTQRIGCVGSVPPPPPPAPVASVAVTPTTVSMAPGETRQLTATVKDANGSVLTGRVVTWNSSTLSVATVSSSGVVTGVSAGSVIITATSEGKSGTASATVTSVSSSTAWPNEPAGFTAMRENSFSVLPPTPGWGILNPLGNDGLPRGSIVTHPSAPLSPSNVLQMRYETGFTGGGGAITVYADFAGTPLKEFFVGLWWKPSNPWQGHPASMNKIFYVYTASNGVLALSMYGAPGGPYYICIQPQRTGYTGGYLCNNVTLVPVMLGQWHRIELYVKYETSANAADGILRWWVNGALAANYTTMPFPDDAGAISWQIAPTWGGLGGTKTQDDFFWFDHAYLSRR